MHDAGLEVLELLGVVVGVGEDDHDVTRLHEPCRRSVHLDLPAAALPGDPPQVEAILMSAFAGGIVELYATPPALASTPGERPVASPLARIQARTGAPLTTLLQTSIDLRDPIARRLVTLLDGTRDRAALIDELLPLAGATKENLAPALDQNLQALSRLGLLLR